MSETIDVYPAQKVYTLYSIQMYNSDVIYINNIQQYDSTIQIVIYHQGI